MKYRRDFDWEAYLGLDLLYFSFKTNGDVPVWCVSPIERCVFIWLSPVDTIYINPLTHTHTHTPNTPLHPRRSIATKKDTTFKLIYSTECRCYQTTKMVIREKSLLFPSICNAEKNKRYPNKSQSLTRFWKWISFLRQIVCSFLIRQQQPEIKMTSIMWRRPRNSVILFRAKFAWDDVAVIDWGNK